MEIFQPPHKRPIRDYNNTNVETINLAIESFNWENVSDGKDIVAEVIFFNETLLNICSNFVPNRKKAFTDSDPPWMPNNVEKIGKV